MVTPALYNRREAAARLGVSVPTIDRLVARRQLRAAHVGRRVLISEDAIRAFISASEQQHGGDAA